jgi:hypothetical protein
MRAGGKILLLTFAAIIFTCVGTSVSFAVNASAVVPTIFSLALDPSSASIDFGSVSQGEWKEISGAAGYANAAICQSNSGKPWTLSISATGPLMSESYTIPLENLKWMTTYAGSKKPPYDTSYLDGLVYPPEEGFQSFTISNIVIFRSINASEMINNNSLPGAEIQFKYAVFIPDSIKIVPGSYTTRVVYTMTE